MSSVANLTFPIGSGPARAGESGLVPSHWSSGVCADANALGDVMRLCALILRWRAVATVNRFELTVGPCSTPAETPRLEKAPTVATDAFKEEAEILPACDETE